MPTSASSSSILPSAAHPAEDAAHSSSIRLESQHSAAAGTEDQDTFDHTAAAATLNMTSDSSQGKLSHGSSGSIQVPSIHVPTSEAQLSNKHRLVSAAIGALLTSLVVTPFDVVKTRLQAQINSIRTPALGVAMSSASRSAAVAAAICETTPATRMMPTASQMLLQDCSHYRIHTGLMDSWCDNCFSKPGQPRVGGTPTPASTTPASSTAALQHSHKHSFSHARAHAPHLHHHHHHHQELRFTGALDAAFKLVKHEGVTSLWRGLSPTILMSVPSTVVYFAMYDKVKIGIAHLTPQRLEHLLPGWGSRHETLQKMSPLMAGVFARAVTTTLVSPIELVRTKSQSLRTSAKMSELLLTEFSKGGFLSLWRGVGPTLMRDVPFSALYWSSYEYSKSWLLTRWGASLTDASSSPSSKKRWVTASFLSGAGSGMVAAAITHPFDLIKTRRQIDLYRQEEAAKKHAHQTHIGCTPGHHAPQPPAVITPSTTRQVARTIIAEEGYRGLLSGLSARMTKIAPACAIMITSYEASKLYFSEGN